MTTSEVVQLCENPKCGNTVPESRNPGVQRIYCSARCARNVANRRYYQREVPGAGKREEQTARGPQVRRRKALNAKQAEKLYKDHSQKCEKTGGGRCPAAMDSYCVERACLMKAVLFEDWNELRRAEKGFDPQPRYLTTEDGYWLPEEVTIAARPLLGADFYDDLRRQGKLRGRFPHYS